MSVVGVILLVILGLWLLGGVLLRLAGVLLVGVAVLGLAFPDAAGGSSGGQALLALALLPAGLVVWLAGQWHHAWKHHYYRSPLAQRVFQQLLPVRLDPTRGWSVPISLLDDPERVRRI